MYCDSASPNMIHELRRRGLNAKAAKKGKDSVVHGINKVRQHHIHVTETSKNVQMEMKKYIWKTNLNTGEVEHPRKPIDQYSHSLDAVRYAISFIMNRKPKF